MNNAHASVDQIVKFKQGREPPEEEIRMQQYMDYPIIFDGDGYEIEAVDTVYITGVTLNYGNVPTTSGELKIILESDYQKDRNRCLFSKDMKGESELDLEPNNPLELRDGEKLWIDYSNSEGIVISGELSFQH